MAAGSTGGAGSDGPGGGSHPACHQGMHLPRP